MAVSKLNIVAMGNSTCTLIGGRVGKLNRKNNTTVYGGCVSHCCWLENERSMAVVEMWQHELCLLVVASANKLFQWEIQHELWRVLSMPVVYLVAFAVFNVGCVCWLNNQ